MSAPTHTNITDLVLENELLTNEVRRLRASVAELEQRVEQSQSSRRPGPGGAQSKQRALERRALEDMRYLMDRADAMHLSRVLRLRKGYRNLEERYGAR